MLDLIYQIVSIQTLMWLIPGLPLVASIFCVAASLGGKGERAGEKVFASTVALISTFLSALASFVIFFTLKGFDVGGPRATTGPLFKWIFTDTLAVEASLLADEISLVMAIVISTVGFLVVMYSMVYSFREKHVARLFSKLLALQFFSLLFVLADNMVIAFIGWHGIGLLAIALCLHHIGNDNLRDKMKIVAGSLIGDALFLIMIFFAYGVMQAAAVSTDASTLGFSYLEKNVAYFLPVSGLFSIIVIFSAATRAAVLPFSFWPKIMAESGANVLAVVLGSTLFLSAAYLIARFSCVFVLSPTAMEVLAVVGALTIFYGASTALVESDILKAVSNLAISQMGFVFMAAGFGSFSTSFFHASAQPAFTVLLFMAAGVVVFTMQGERNISKMGGLKRRMPVTTWCFVIAAASASAIFPFSGFFAKEAIIREAFEKGYTFIWVLGFLGVGLGAFATFRLAGAVFFGNVEASEDTYKRVSEGPVSMLIPMMLLATVTLFMSFLNIPEVFGGNSVFFNWALGAVTDDMSIRSIEPSLSSQVILMVAIVLWSAHFSILGWIIYSQKRDWPRRMSEKFKLVHDIVENGYYIGTLFGFAFAAPIAWSMKKGGEPKTYSFGRYGSSNIVSKTIGLFGELALMFERASMQICLILFVVALLGVILVLAL